MIKKSEHRLSALSATIIAAIVLYCGVGIIRDREVKTSLARIEAEQDKIEYRKKSNLNSIVRLYSPDVPGYMGTGFRIKTKSGISVIMTANHVCDGALFYSYMIVKRDDTEHNFMQAYIIDKIPAWDLCLLTDVFSSKGQAVLGEAEARLGDYVMSAGHPNDETLKITTGVVNNEYEVLPASLYFITTKHTCLKMHGKIDREFSKSSTHEGKLACYISESQRLVKTTMITHPGASGSPVWDSQGGGVVGVITQVDTKDHNHAYIVQYEKVKAVLDSY